jgi:histidyl-tRNA synthetase
LALAQLCGGEDRMIDITIAIDKLDKIGIEKVREELAQRSINQEQIFIIESYLNINGSNEEKLKTIKELFHESDTGKAGIQELEFVLNTTQNAEAKCRMQER